MTASRQEQGQETMFLGQYRHALDEKARITLPAKFRPQFGAGLVMTAGTEPCIWVYPAEEFARLAERINALPVTGQEAAAFRRLIYGNAFDANMDKQGRVVLPEKLRRYAGIETEVVVTGVGRFVEIWSPAGWDRAQEAIQARGAPERVWAELGI